MKIQKILTCVIALIFTVFTGIASAQTRWSLVYEMLNFESNGRLVYSEGEFHVAWQGTNYGMFFDTPIYYDMIETTPSPDVFIIDDFTFSNLSFEIDGTPVFSGADRFEDDLVLIDVSSNLNSFERRIINDPFIYFFNQVRVTNIAYGANKYVASFSDDSGGLISPLATSVDLETWTDVILPSGYSIENIIFDDGKFVAIGNYRNPDFQQFGVGDGSVILTSVDGEFWSVVNLGGDETLTDVTYTGSQWIAVDSQGSVWSSINGFSWQQMIVNNLHGTLTAVSGGNGYILVGNADGEVFSSRNGIDFISQGNFGDRINDIVVGNNKFMAVSGPSVFESTFALEGIADIINHPESDFIVQGDTRLLSVAVQGEGSFTYQWYIGNSGDVSTPINGATSSSYQTPILSETQRYWVRVQNGIGFDDSLTATLTMQFAPSITSQPSGDIIRECLQISF